MAILKQTAELLLREHLHDAIRGDVLLIGRQTVTLTDDEARELCRDVGIQPNKGQRAEIDQSTVARGNSSISDRSFFSLFSDAKVRAVDVSDYEDAELIHDLNNPLRDDLQGVADFIFNGSCLDNLFDPATAIVSMSKMLRPGGRIVHIEHGTPLNGAFLCYSPEWFYEFYAENGYTNCSVFTCSFTSIDEPWAIRAWRPGQPMNPGDGDFVLFVVADKGADSSDDRKPIQGHYRSGPPRGDTFRPRPYVLNDRAPDRRSVKHKLLGLFRAGGIEIEKGGALRYRLRRRRSELSVPAGYVGSRS